MRRALLLIALLAEGLLAAPRFAADRPIDCLHLRVDGTIDLEKKTFRATATLRMKTLREVSTVVLDAVKFKTAGVAVEVAGAAAAAPWRDDGSRIEIALPGPTEAGTALTVKVTYEVVDPEAGLLFFGPTPEQPEVPWQCWSQGETEDNRYWIPCFDHPNDRLTSEIAVRVKSGLKALSNGRLAEMRDNGDGTATWHWTQESDHVPYLVSLVVGDFAVIEETWRGRPVQYWVPPAARETAMLSFGNTRRMLDFFSDRIGVEYPWVKYAQVVVEQFSFGGMENTTATTLNDYTLHDARAHLDFRSDGLVSHELAHQWFGDLLTCRDWAHTWLNEGFASYFEALWDEQDLGADEFAYNMLEKARSAIGGGKALPIVHRGYDGAWVQFDSRSYPKGAWVVHMLRRRLGDELFWRCIREYVTRYAHRCVETVDLRKTVEEVTGRSFERFFYDWTERPGNPVVRVRFGWNNESKLGEIEVNQTQNEEEFRFPLRLEFRFAQGPALALNEEIDARHERFFFPLPQAPILVRVDPGATVLMELTEEKGRDLLLAQLRDDPDPVARIRAAGQFADARDAGPLAEALGRERFWAVQSEIAAALGRVGGGAARDALLKAVTVENPKARRAVVEALGKFRDDALVEAALRGILLQGDPSYAVEAAAISAWAGLRPEAAMETLTPLLARESHRDQIRKAVLQGIGDQIDGRSIELLLGWTQRGRPRECRAAALGALSKAARAPDADPAAVLKVVQAALACLGRGEHRGVKNAASALLRDLGGVAAPALPTLEALSLHDPNEGVRNEAKSALEKIRSGAPAHLELDRLREEMNRLRESNRQLGERLEKLERKAPLPADR